MAEKSKSPEDVHVQNVSWHRGGKEEVGTLSLTRFHLTFSYVPRAKQAHKDRRGHWAPTTSGSTTALPEGTSTLSQESTGSATGPNASQNEPTTPKKQGPKQKVLWVPYPMINKCVLRPSHAQSAPGTTSFSEKNAQQDGDELFPPTFGTGYERASTDSARMATSSPQRSSSPTRGMHASPSTHSSESARPPAIRLRCRDFQMMAFHFHHSSTRSPDDAAREVFFQLRERCCVDSVDDMLAFHFQPPAEEKAFAETVYDVRKELARMGIGEKVAEGPGASWRVTDINKYYGFSETYPSLLCVPRSVSDNMLKYGGVFRSRCRIPALAYLHFNGGSITRSSQPLVGVQGKRNPQDERLVSAIFASHAPSSGLRDDGQAATLTSTSTTTLESTTSDASGTTGGTAPKDFSQDESIAEDSIPAARKIYGSTRRNLIVDARPRLNAIANKATGGGIEDVSNYTKGSEAPVEKVFLNIQNIHVMRSSLEKVIDSMANSDYLNLPPDQDALRKSGWLGHIAGLLEGSEMVAKLVGLGGSHVLVHCSDGWDRTSQVSALAQLMLDPYYRTLDGFITLVQKDFLSFGHKFRDRIGIQGSEKWFEIENERIAPARGRDGSAADVTSLNVLGTKALTGARNWFEKSRGGLFRQPNTSQPNLDSPSPRSSSPPPPNPLIHSVSQANSKEDKEHKTKEKEIAPIFHQFLEAIYQLQRQYPTAFEFNERFLLRLLYQAYAGQYKEFLFNNEKERLQHSKLPSVWPYFLARRNDFINPDYTSKPDDTLLLPKRGVDQQIEVRWWNKLFGRSDEEMNVPRALAVTDHPPLTAESSTASINDSSTDSLSTLQNSPLPLKETRSAPSLSKWKDSLPSAFAQASINETSTPMKADPASLPNASDTPPLKRPTAIQQETDQNVLARYAAPASADDAHAESSGDVSSSVAGEQRNGEFESDPLGVSNNLPARKQEVRGLDYAAFAADNAFRER